MSGAISLWRNEGFPLASTSNAALSYLECRAESTSNAVFLYLECRCLLPRMPCHATSNAVPSPFFRREKPYPECRSKSFALQGLGYMNLVGAVDFPGVDCARGLDGV
jgi:hypothetical protein